MSKPIDKVEAKCQYCFIKLKYKRCFLIKINPIGMEFYCVNRDNLGSFAYHDNYCTKEDWKECPLNED
jgi:hypothetical protein